MKKLLLFLVSITLSATFQTVHAQDRAQVLEEVPFDYMTRNPIYDYTESQLSNTDSIPDFQSKENPLKITGTVYKSDGVTPAQDVIVFIYQADETGMYDVNYDRQKKYVKHRGWVKTDANGSYTFYTFIPGSYPHSKELRLIHPTIKEEGKEAYGLPSFVFDDDPYLTKMCRKKLAKKNLDIILKTEKMGNMYVANKDIVLKENAELFK